MHTLKCGNCGATYDCKNSTMICTNCGNIAKMVPLADGAFEDAQQGEEIVKPEPPAKKKKADKDTTNRPDEQGGRTF